MTFPLTLPELIAAAQGEVLSSRGPAAGEISDITLDSRAAAAGSVFLCQVGASVDSHDFIDTAVRQGCCIVIGENREKLTQAAARHTELTIVAVDEARSAAQRIATAMRHALSIPVIAITGACGKTSTKDLCGGILRSIVPAVVTPVNNNNLWGVPLTLMELRASHKAAVIELGTNEHGEVAQLAPIVDPTITYTTSIGPSHLMNLGDLNGVLRAETEHIEWLLAHGRRVTFLGNIDDPILRGFYESRMSDLKAHGDFFSVSSTPGSGADIGISRVTPLGFEANFGYAFDFYSPWGNGTASLPLPGLYNVQNALAAIALALATGLCTPAQASEALRQPKLSPLRSELLRLASGALFLNDCYNANPLSMRSAFDTVTQIRANHASGIHRTIAVLGDMLELGDKERDYHVEIGDTAARTGFELVLTSGAFADAYQRGFEGSAREVQAFRRFPNREALFEDLCRELATDPAHTLVLVKGSKGSKIYEVAGKLKEGDR